MEVAPFFNLMDVHPIATVPTSYSPFNAQVVIQPLASSVSANGHQDLSLVLFYLQLLAFQIQGSESGRNISYKNIFSLNLLSP